MLIRNQEYNSSKKVLVQGPFKKKKDTLGILLTYGTPLFLLMIWALMVHFEWIRPQVLPSPITISSTLFDLLISGELLAHVSISLWRIIQGFSIGASLGIIFGLLIGLNKRMEQATSLITGVLRPIPNLAWVPVLILWMGIDESSKVTVIAIAAFWPVLINISDGVKLTERKFLEVAETFEKSKRTKLTKIILPSTIPSIFTGLRFGMNLAWRSVVGAELIAASAGIGFMISHARLMTQTDVMFGGVLVIGLIGLMLDQFFKIIEKRMLHWNPNI